VSVTFRSRSIEIDLADASTYLNVANINAGDLLRWLSLPAYDEHGCLCGELPAAELSARCRRRLWPEARNFDPARAATDFQVPGRARVIDCGRPEGYLRERTEQLLALCERDRESIIDWS
jgi:hypothetical protein